MVPLPGGVRSRRTLSLSSLSLGRWPINMRRNVKRSFVSSIENRCFENLYLTATILSAICNLQLRTRVGWRSSSVFCHFLHSRKNHFYTFLEISFYFLHFSVFLCSWSFYCLFVTNSIIIHSNGWPDVNILSNNKFFVYNDTCRFFIQQIKLSLEMNQNNSLQN